MKGKIIIGRMYRKPDVTPVITIIVDVTDFDDI